MHALRLTFLMPLHYGKASGLKSFLHFCFSKFTYFLFWSDYFILLTPCFSQCALGSMASALSRVSLLLFTLGFLIKREDVMGAVTYIQYTSGTLIQFRKASRQCKYRVVKVKLCKINCNKNILNLMNVTKLMGFFGEIFVTIDFSYSLTLR